MWSLDILHSWTRSMSSRTDLQPARRLKILQVKEGRKTVHRLVHWLEWKASLREKWERQRKTTSEVDASSGMDNYSWGQRPFPLCCLIRTRSRATFPFLWNFDKQKISRLTDLIVSHRRLSVHNSVQNEIIRFGREDISENCDEWRRDGRKRTRIRSGETGVDITRHVLKSSPFLLIRNCRKKTGII